MRDTSTMNPFNRSRERRAEALKQSTAVEQRKVKVQKQRESWQGDKRPSPTSGTGTVLDAKTLDAKRAFERERAAATQQTENPQSDALSISLGPEDTTAILNAWKQRMGPKWNETELNHHNLVNCLLLNLSERRLTGFNMESLDRVFEYLQANGYYEYPSVRIRGTSREVPKVFPSFKAPVVLTEAQKAEQLKEEVEYQNEQARVEERAARATDFATLRQQVRSGFDYAKMRERE